MYARMLPFTKNKQIKKKKSAIEILSLRIEGRTYCVLYLLAIVTSSILLWEFAHIYIYLETSEVHYWVL